jgi:hypothetical protein
VLKRDGFGGHIESDGTGAIAALRRLHGRPSPTVDQFTHPLMVVTGGGVGVGAEVLFVAG